MPRNQRNNCGNQQHRHHSSADTCVCPRCGYSVPHLAGNPCRLNTCPTCNIELVRAESKPVDKLVSSEQLIKNELISTEQSVDTNNKPQDLRPFPLVDVDLCTGCETCIENCPTNAIIMVDGKAFIKNKLCKKCRKCVRVCPVNAIS